MTLATPDSDRRGRPSPTERFTERLVGRLSGSRREPGPAASRRGLLGGAALVGAAMAVDPWGFLVRPVHAYDAVCGEDAGCNDGYSVFCCTINGANTCPPNSFIGGWWKADNSSFCGGAARYYIDCNAFRNGAWQCRCGQGTCDQRRIACNQFRYGQCSLHIPMSDTGPVVCRMVSCTPPWEQFGGTCTSWSATDNRTATHSAPCLSRAPIGSVDSVTVSGRSVRLRGWAFDPDNPAARIQVAVYADSAGINHFPTGVPRPDVNTAYGITGDHGYDITVTRPFGPQTMKVYAINIGAPGSNPLIGSRAINVGSRPRGRLDSVAAGPNGTIRLTGWAYDPDQSGTAISVAVHRDGTLVRTYPTGVPRPDVNRVFAITGNHGFDIALPAPPGPHTAQVYAVNIVGGTGNPLIGQGQARVGTPVGNLESAISTAPRTVTARAPPPRG